MACPIPGLTTLSSLFLGYVVRPCAQRLVALVVLMRERVADPFRCAHVHCNQIPAVMVSLLALAAVVRRLCAGRRALQRRCCVKQNDRGELLVSAAHA